MFAAMMCDSFERFEAPDDVVAARQDAFDHPLSVAAFGADHLVAHDDRIGRAEAFEADAAADAAGDRAPFVQHVVPAPRGTGDDSSDLGVHAFCSFSVVSGFSAGSSRSGRGRYCGRIPPAREDLVRHAHHRCVAFGLFARGTGDEFGIEIVGRLEGESQQQHGLQQRQRDAQQRVETAQSDRAACLLTSRPTRLAATAAATKTTIGPYGGRRSLHVQRLAQRAP